MLAVLLVRVYIAIGDAAVWTRTVLFFLSILKTGVWGAQQEQRGPLSDLPQSSSSRLGTTAW